MWKKSYSRRRFLKTGMACAVGLSTSREMVFQKRQTGAVSRTSLKTLQAIPTTCKQCAAGCGVIAYLNGSQLVQILGNPEHPINIGRICAKGVTGINLANDPERILFPMKRKGPRGDPTWTRITWDEAYSVLSQRINGLIQEGSANEVVWDIGANDPLLNRFINACGAGIRIDRALIKNKNREAALQSMIGSSTIREDVEGSRLVLNFGANPYAHHDRFFPLVQQLVNARIHKGTRLVTFDVRMSETAAQSDEWFAIRPGTDAMVALAMAHVILAKNLADNRLILSLSNVSIDQLRSHLAPYSPAAAERESGIKATEIERLAAEFASLKPSSAIFGGGIEDHKNGTQNVRCISLLNWITGNLDEAEGLFNPEKEFLFHKNLAERDILGNTEDNVVSFSDLLEKKHKVQIYFAYLSNPSYSEPDCSAAARFLKDQDNVPFLVVADTHLTETAQVADLVLPAASYLEGWGVEVKSCVDGRVILNLRQPVVSLLSSAETLRKTDFETGKLLEPHFRPRGEAKEIGTVCLELARRLGKDFMHHLPFRDTKDFIQKAVTSIPGCDLEKLMAKGFWTDQALAVDLLLSRMNRSGLKGKSVWIDSQAYEKLGASTPSYSPIEAHKELKDNEFILTTYKSNLWARGAANSKWAREIFHENRVWINQKIAKKLHIRNGERVRIVSSLGVLEVRVLTTGRIHPRSAALAEGLGHEAVGNVAKAKRFQSPDLDTALVWWTEEGHGVNPFSIIENQKDPLGGGYALKDTVIRLEKIERKSSEK